MTPPKLQIDKSATVSSDIRVLGNYPVTLGANTVVHPRAVFAATNGPIHIGENNLIEELVRFENLGNSGGAMEISGFNHFHPGAKIMAKEIGERNVFESFSEVGKDASVGSGCVVGSLAAVDGCLSDGHVVYSMHDVRERESGDGRVRVRVRVVRQRAKQGMRNLAATQSSLKIAREKIEKYHKLYTDG